MEILDKKKFEEGDFSEISLDQEEMNFCKIAGIRALMKAHSEFSEYPFSKSDSKDPMILSNDELGFLVHIGLNAILLEHSEKRQA